MFHYQTFTFHLTAKDVIVLPRYKGSTIRGGFGNSFRKIACTLKKNDCYDCILKEKCVYSYVFETQPPSNTKIMTKYTHAPHPFIIEPPDEQKRVYKPGDEIIFKLTLIGKAIDYIPYFIYTFDELGKIGIGKGRGRFALQTVKSQESEVKSERIAGAKDKIIYDSDTKRLKPFDRNVLNFESLTLNTQSPDSLLLTLNFETPTRIIYNSRLTLDLKFHILIRQLLRRISLLAYFHCGVDISDWDYKGMIKKAEEVKIAKSNLSWYDWERYSARQDTRMKLGGFIGETTFEGNIKPFMPLIKAGEVLHVGKGTSFGLGKYKIK